MDVNRPLGRRAYFSIPHLPGSRTGPADRTISEGQARICTEAPRDHLDVVIVSEKLDGSCVAVARIGDEIVALGREGRLASASPNLARQMFADWVAARADRFAAALEPGERMCGEWLALAHSTRYQLDDNQPFVAFDLFRGAERRLLWSELEVRAARARVPTAHVISSGPPLAIDAAIERLGPRGFHGAVDTPEGAVWRVERRDRCDFLAKFVRPGKVDGALLPENTGEPAVWNWRPEPVG